MAVEHDTSYADHAPADTKELLDKLREGGETIPNPVWTVGRLDEREEAKGNGKSDGNGQPD